MARSAGELALQHAARGVEREDKSDDSPVTIADRECERLIVSELRAAFPGDGVLGEEGADHGGTTGRRWIVDPIDGTRDFLRGRIVSVDGTSGTALKIDRAGRLEIAVDHGQVVTVESGEVTYAG